MPGVRGGDGGVGEPWRAKGPVSTQPSQAQASFGRDTKQPRDNTKPPAPYCVTVEREGGRERTETPLLKLM